MTSHKGLCEVVLHIILFNTHKHLKRYYDTSFKDEDTDGHRGTLPSPRTGSPPLSFGN